MTLGKHVDPSDEVTSLRRLSEEVVYEGDRRLVRRRYASPDGGDGGDGEMTFDVVLDGPGTAVLALTDDGDVVLTRQFRPGAERVVWDLPGGFVDDGETPAAAAARELREETGYEATEVDVVASMFPSAYSTEQRHAVVARGCRRTSRPDTDEDERVEVRLVSVDELRRIVRAGELTAVDAAYLALDHAGLL